MTAMSLTARVRASLPGLALLAFLPLMSAAQEADFQEPVQESMDVKLVTLDVTVTEEGGAPGSSFRTWRRGDTAPPGRCPRSLERSNRPSSPPWWSPKGCRERSPGPSSAGWPEPPRRSRRVSSARSRRRGGSGTRLWSGSPARGTRTPCALWRPHPDSFEGRLRLAVNLRRTGLGSEAEVHLRRLLAEASPEWIQVVAWQELARALLDAGRDREAALLLRQALERWPHQQQLAIQLAWMLRRQGAAEEARELLAGLRPKPDQAGRSPRHSYNQWPETALEQPRCSLLQQALVRLSALSRALATLPDQGGV